MKKSLIILILLLSLGCSTTTKPIDGLQNALEEGHFYKVENRKGWRIIEDSDGNLVAMTISNDQEWLSKEVLNDEYYFLDGKDIFYKGQKIK